jgi:hypothetical protein
VFGSTSPFYGQPWNPTGYYELKIDTNRDYVEDITFRATFPIGAERAQHVQHVQHVQVKQLTGPACAGTPPAHAPSLIGPLRSNGAPAP